MTELSFDHSSNCLEKLSKHFQWWSRGLGAATYKVVEHENCISSLNATTTVQLVTRNTTTILLK
jgi:hypothetical protein